MGKQDHSFPFTGRVGKLSFFKSRTHGHMVRARTGVSKDRIENAPSYELTRQNMAEFGIAAKAGKLVRTTFRNILLGISDGRMIGRLSKTLRDAVLADGFHDRGARTVADGDPTVLKGFEFNANSILLTSLVAPYSTLIDRANGKLSVTIPSFIPKKMIVAPSGSTHYKIISAGAEIDFAMGNNVVDFQNSNILPIDKNPTALLTLENTVTANSAYPLFLVLGVEYYLQVNGNMHLMNSGAFNALAIVEANKI